MKVSGRQVVASPGTAVALGSGPVAGPLLVKALPGNQGEVYLGNKGPGGVDAASVLVLEAGDEVVFYFVGRLETLYLDAALPGEGVSWIMLNI